jgi:glycosyltransferase involved in cell wall biosynthesis
MTRAATSLHVAQLGFFSDPARRAPQELLAAWSTLVDVAEAVGHAGISVSVIQSCHQPARLTRAGVHYHFLPFGEQSGSGYAALTELLRALAPDVLHVHGLGFPGDVLALAAVVPDVPLVLQDHASQPPRIWRRALWRRSFAAASALAFCAAEQARPFAAAGLLTARTRVYAIPESTSRFTPGDREQARHDSGVHGDPAVLWIGHLDANKDPLTVLSGISIAARQLPALRLWCCFGVAPLRPAVEKRIAGDPWLRERVQLLGRVAHERVEQLMRAADLFVLGSHREGSGYSLIEALACGLSPVVSDIPSFRALTAAGAVGALWPCGDAVAFSRQLQAVAARVGSASRLAVRAHFERELSSRALGEKLAAMYREVVAARRPSSAAAHRVGSG